MCRRVTCHRCGKPTFSGCGAHVEQVLASVPKEDRCRCGEVSEPTHGGPVIERAGGVAGWLRGLLRRK